MKRRVAAGLALVLISTALPSAALPDQGPHRAALPASTLRLAADSLVVPMEIWRGISVVKVLVDGRGPFPFLLDSGAEASMVTSAFAELLRLPVEGRGQVTSPLEGTPLPATLVHLGGIAIGGSLEASIYCLAADLPTSGPQPYWGILSANQLPGLLVTWDFTHRRVTFRRGQLPTPDGRQVFSYEGDVLPSVPVLVAGRLLRVGVDTGSPCGLMLPASLQDSLPLSARPVKGGMTRTVDREVRVFDARLAGIFVMGGRVYADPPLELNPAARRGNVGNQVLVDFETTLDAQQRRIRLRPIEAPGGRAAGALPAGRP